ncbi:MAG: repeat protein [Bacteroidetes bacterium]|jgi:hypothetical protein|nr:repeat protein [Bacteroidota bacterium]
MKELTPFKVLFFFVVLSLFSHAQVIYNGYAKVTAVTGGSVLTVSNVNTTNHSFNTSEYVIVMQMQDDVIGANTGNNVNFGNLSAIQNAGRYELAQILAVNPTPAAPTSITLTAVLANAYNTGANSSLQVITFRRLSATAFTSTNNITGLAWDGNRGGVIALEVPTVFTLNHNISADYLGFRGGAKNTPNGYTACENVTYRNAIATRYAGKGEGIYKATNAAYAGARGKILNGGGGGNDVNAGGGGGGNYTAGGNGGLGWVPAGTGCSPSVGGIGGLALSGNITASRIFMGGGGGGGHENDGLGTVGGNGGGIILIKTGTLVTSGACGSRLISANGATITNASNDGSGGGGAAGSIVFQVNTFSVVGTCPLSVQSNGGNGGLSNTTGVHGGGGGGAQGVIIYSGTTPTVNVTNSAVSGSGGMSCSGCGAGSGGSSGSGPNNSGVLQDQQGPLPIELKYFRVENMDDKVELKWATASEKNTNYFIVERSSDGHDWEQFQKHKAAENSSHTLYYESFDEAPLIGISYYRLRTVDLDLSEHLSEIRTVDRSGKDEFVIFFPNPAADVLNIASSGKSSDIDFAIFDIAGKKIDVVVIDQNESKIVLNVAGFPRGVYFINIKSATGAVSNKIILK